MEADKVFLSAHLVVVGPLFGGLMLVWGILLSKPYTVAYIPAKTVQAHERHFGGSHVSQSGGVLTPKPEPCTSHPEPPPQLRVVGYRGFLG